MSRLSAIAHPISSNGLRACDIHKQSKLNSNFAEQILLDVPSSVPRGRVALRPIWQRVV